MFVCWECEKTFGTNDALKMHLANHGFTRVLCPWCYDQKRMFRRIVDFKMHVKSAHPAISKKDGELSFLKEKNGFFIADSPMNYRRTMGTVPPEDSAAAIFLKSAIEDWCEKFVGRVDRPKEEWHALWRKYGGILSPDHQPELDYGNSYSPTRPDIDAIISLDIGSSGAVAVIYGPVGEGNIAFRRLTISRIAVADQKKRDRLMRRMLCITEKPTFSPPPPEIWEDLDGTTERCLPRMLDALGMDASDLCRVEKRRAATKRKAVQETLESTKDSSTPITKEADRPIHHDESQEVIGPGGDQAIEDVLETNFPVNEEEVGQATTKKAATSLQLRAHKLLVNGAMPLFPPARRDWSCGASITLPISGPLACWPPVGWETMSPDAKLLSWETVATILFTSGMGELPDDRGSILDTFQFLALPGTKEGKRLSSVAEHMRFCNFRVVRKIATGDYKGKDATTIIEQFEAACKPMLLPTFVSEISELLRDIPLRMR